MNDSAERDKLKSGAEIIQEVVTREDTPPLSVEERFERGHSGMKTGCSAHATQES